MNKKDLKQIKHLNKINQILIKKYLTLKTISYIIKARRGRSLRPRYQY